MPALRVSVVFGGPNDPAATEWDDKFQQLTGINPAASPDLHSEERNINGKWTYSFVLYTDDGVVNFSNIDEANGAAVQYQEQLRQGGLRPLPHPKTGWGVLGTTTQKVSPGQAEIIDKKLAEEGATESERKQVLEETLKVRVVEDGAPRIRKATTPSRFRDLTSETGRSRDWETYVLPGHTIPYWQEMGLHYPTEKETVDPDLWRIVYRQWYRTTPAHKQSQQKYNKVEGRKVQKRWEKTDLGKATRARYFQGPEGKKARAASQVRSKIRLKLGRALRGSELPEEAWINEINDPDTGGTGQRWMHVIMEARQRFGTDMHDDDIERIFWEQGLRPQIRTEKDLWDWLHREDATRINPGTGEDLI